jgi:N-dimethylarginine dimethylaminohydrolase
LLGVLADLGLSALTVEPGSELVARRANNFVALGPRRIVMPDGCPVTRARFEAHGVACEELCVDEYVKAAGALGCLTGILSRAFD